MAVATWQVTPSQLPRWSDLDVDTDSIDSSSLEESLLDDHAPVHENAVFPSDETLNCKVTLWQGNLLQLDVDAIVHPTTERFERLSRLSNQLYKHAGPQLRRCLFNRLKNCKTGSVKVTKGYSILPRHIIHTASPQYNGRYRSAGENSLFNCYYNVLLAAKLYHFRTLALGPLTLAHYGYPEEEATHLGLRVVRRFLERFPDSFDLIIFAVSPQTAPLYSSLFPLYFPRDSSEELLQRFYLPANVGGESGEPFRPERQIRIKESPICSLAESQEWSSSATSSCCEHSSEEDSDWRSSSLVSSIGRSKFARMQETCRDIKYRQEATDDRLRSKSIVSVLNEAIGKPDLDHRSMAASLNSKAHHAHSDRMIREEFQRQLRCQRLQRKVSRLSVDRQAALTKLRQCIYIDGVDSQGRAILTIIGNRFLAESMSSPLTLLYAVELFEKLSRQEYVIVYFQTGVTEINLPKAEFLSKMNELLGYQHRVNLHRIYIVHPSLWSRLYFFWAKNFHFKSLKSKFTFVSHLSQIKGDLSHGWLLRVPSFIQQAD